MGEWDCAPEFATFRVFEHKWCLPALPGGGQGVGLSARVPVVAFYDPASNCLVP